MIFYVLELQTTTTGSCIPFSFDNQADAEAKYHSLLAVAAVSDVPKHGALLVNADGFVIKSEVYDHTEPGPEPVPEV